MDQVQFSPRKLNTESFDNKDTISESELRDWLQKGQVEVYTEESIAKFREDALNTIEKSEDATDRKEIQEAAETELKKLHKHIYKGSIVYLKAKEQEETFEKGEEINYVVCENDIVKSHLTDMFQYGSLSKLEFAKKGSEIKQDIQNKINTLTAERTDIQSKMTDIITAVAPCVPTDPMSDYRYSGMKSKIGEVLTFSYPSTCYRTDQNNSMADSDSQIAWASSQQQADMCQMYNMLCDQYVSRGIDIEYLTLFMNNLQDGKSYSFTLPQLADLGIEKGEENDIEKGGAGSRGGKIIGHTKSGKPIYASKNAMAEKKYTSKDHEDAAYAHLDESTRLAKDKKENQAETHSNEYDRHMETKVHKKKNEDLDEEDSKKKSN